MMESMVHNPRPTRAEATDVANAILDGTDAVMLSAETAVGKNPELVVRNMAKIAAKTESSSTFAKMRTMRERSRITEATEAVAYAACEIAENLNAKSILTFSTSGFTARMMAKYRPRVPILCATYRERTAKQVSLLWGVKPILTSEFSGTEEMIEKGFRAALKNKLLKVGDLVVITAGIPVGKPGTTNLVTLMNVHEPKKDK
jgi:pyruvate kinase